MLVLVIGISGEHERRTGWSYAKVQRVEDMTADFMGAGRTDGTAVSLLGYLPDCHDGRATR
jgi:hypothetical protein